MRMRKHLDSLKGKTGRGVLLGLFVVLAVSTLLMIIQNFSGALLFERRPLTADDVRKEQDGAVRIWIHPSGRKFSPALQRKVAVFEDGVRLEKKTNRTLVWTGAPGVYSVANNLVWIKPVSGYVDDLTIIAPARFSTRAVVAVAGGTIILLGVLGWIGVFRAARDRLAPSINRLRGKIRDHPWVPVCVSLVLMLLCFQHHVLTNVAPYIPRYHDQVEYLQSAYSFADQAVSRGLAAPILGHFFQIPADSGFEENANMNLPLVVGYLLHFFGGGRLTALSVNFFSWASFLIVAYWCFKRLGKNASYGWLAVGFFLFTNMAMVGAGGIDDFRLDFVSACWMGISVALWAVFLHYPGRRCAWIASFSTGVLVFVRLISAASIGIPLLFLFGVAIWSRFSGGRKDLANALVPLIALGAWTGLLVGINLEFIKFYYIDNSLGPVLEARGGVTIEQDGILETFRYYPEMLIKSHFGMPALGLLLAGVLSVFCVFLIQRRRAKRGMSLEFRWEAMLFVTLATVFPLFVLSMNPHRISHVAGIAAIPFGILGLLFVVSARKFLNRRAVSLCGAILLVSGTFYWSTRLEAGGPFAGGGERDGEAMNMVIAEMNFNLAELPRSERTVAVLDFIDASVGFWFLPQEKFDSRETVTCVFPDDIAEMELSEMRSIVGKVSAVIAPRDGSILSLRPYPISQSIEENFDALIGDVKARLPRYSSFYYKGVLYDLYMKSAFPEESRPDAS